MTSLALVLMMMWMQAQVTIPCPLYAHGINLCEPIDTSKHQPMDVPAIQVHADSAVVWDGDFITCSNGGKLIDAAPFEHKCIDGKRWSCADKSRGLWHTEDGKQHWCRRAQP